MPTYMGIHDVHGVTKDDDFRGTLGVDQDAPVGFARIRLGIAVDTDAGGEELGKLLELAERYCVVFQTLRRGVEIRAAYVDELLPS